GNGPRGFARQLVVRGTLRMLDAFLAVGAPQRQFALDFGVPRERIFSSPYAVDNDFFIAAASSHRAKRVAVLRQLGLDPALPTILFISKLTPRKRPGDLLNAYAGLDGVQANLVFVGDGPLRPSLEQAVSDCRLSNVRFVGFKNQHELPAFYAAGDMFVLP